MKVILTFSLILLSIILLTGCVEEEDRQEPEIISVTPVDGAIYVTKTTNVQVEFNESMDTESCESRFGLHRGELIEMPMMGMMAGLSGIFHWNDDNTMMTFEPDSVLMDSTMYTICLMEGMETENHNGSMMMTGMMGYGSQADNGIFSKFTTK